METLASTIFFVSLDERASPPMDLCHVLLLMQLSVSPPIQTEIVSSLVCTNDFSYVLYVYVAWQQPCIYMYLIFFLYFRSF
jgi:hypothetical protein